MSLKSFKNEVCRKKASDIMVELDVIVFNLAQAGQNIPDRDKVFETKTEADLDCAYDKGIDAC